MRTFYSVIVGLNILVALLHVADVQRSIDFYKKLGFELGREPVKNDANVARFAWMHHGQTAQIMLGLTGRPLNPGNEGSKDSGTPIPVGWEFQA